MHRFELFGKSFADFRVREAIVFAAGRRNHGEVRARLARLVATQPCARAGGSQRRPRALQARREHNCELERERAQARKPASAREPGITKYH